MPPLFDAMAGTRPQEAVAGGAGGGGAGRGDVGAGRDDATLTPSQLMDRLELVHWRRSVGSWRLGSSGCIRLFRLSVC